MADSGMQFRNVSRREFLNYVWAGSLAIFMAASGGAMLAFAMPRFKEGEFGGTFTVGTVAEKLPAPDSPPVNYPDLKFWLVNVGPTEAAKGGGIEGPGGSLQSVRAPGLLVCLGRFHCPL